MEIDTSVLKELGFTDAQIKIYITLSRLDKITSGIIIKETGLQSSVVYNTLNQLIEKGLVSYILRGKIKYFYSNDLQSLQEYIDDKKKRVSELIQKLPKLKKEEKYVKTFEGWRGIYSALIFVLENLEEGSDYLAFAGDSDTKYPERAIRMFKEFQKKRSTKNLNVKIIANEEARKSIDYNYYKNFGKPDIRFVKGFSPSETIIFEGHILLIDFEEKPIATLIKSRTLYESNKKSFNSMWKISKK